MMEAYDANAVVERLHREDFFPLRVEPAASRAGLGRRLFGAPRVPARDVLAFTQRSPRWWRRACRSSGAVVLGEVAASRRLRQIVQDVTQSVRAGSTLADALAPPAPPFSRLYVNTVRAGERGGVLEMSLRRLAEHLDAARELREAIVSALIYPALLAVVGAGAVVFLLTFVLPASRSSWRTSARRSRCPRGWCSRPATPCSPTGGRSRRPRSRSRSSGRPSPDRRQAGSSSTRGSSGFRSRGTCCARSRSGARSGRSGRSCRRCSAARRARRGPGGR